MKDAHVVRVDKISATIRNRESRFERIEVDAHWKNYIELHSGRRLFDGAIFELIGWAIETEALQLAFRKSRYAEFVFARTIGEKFNFCHPATCFHDRGARFLFVRMAEHTGSPGLFTFPGGAPDESDEHEDAIDLRKCAIRENFEEIGISDQAYSFDTRAVAVLTHQEMRLTVVFFAPISKWDNFCLHSSTKMNSAEIDAVLSVERKLIGDLPHLDEYILPAIETYFDQAQARSNVSRRNKPGR
jgi:8-oxo-dGTP pyrophosphatase MutT (NUDIX family)